MNLRNKALSIINQKACTDDDILELSRISFKMSIAYSKAREIVWEMEWNYNKSRSEKTLEAKKEIEWISMSESEQTGKFYAECKYWEYRKHYESCVWMRSVIEQIDAFRIAYYRKEKWIETALNSWIE